MSGTEFDRNMLQFMGGAENTRTISFPNTVRHVDADSFKGHLSLRSAVLNEGLERLGGLEYYGGQNNV